MCLPPPLLVRRTHLHPRGCIGGEVYLLIIFVDPDLLLLKMLINLAKIICVLTDQITFFLLKAGCGALCLLFLETKECRPLCQKRNS